MRGPNAARETAGLAARASGLATYSAAIVTVDAQAISRKTHLTILKTRNVNLNTGRPPF